MKHQGDICIMKMNTVVNDIIGALFELLKKKALADITVTELIKTAGVCRASFYRNFYLMEDVIRKYADMVYDEIDRMIPLERNGIREHVLAVNTHLYAHRERLALIEKRGLYHLLEEPMMRQCKKQLQRLDIQTHRYQPEFYSGAVNQLVRAWIRNGFVESPEEITKIIWELSKSTPYVF